MTTYVLRGGGKRTLVHFYTIGTKAGFGLDGRASVEGAHTPGPVPTSGSYPVTASGQVPHESAAVSSSMVAFMGIQD